MTATEWAKRPQRLCQTILKQVAHICLHRFVKNPTYICSNLGQDWFEGRTTSFVPLALAALRTPFLNVCHIQGDNPKPCKELDDDKDHKDDDHEHPPFSL